MVLPDLVIEPVAAPTAEVVALLTELDAHLGGLYEPQQRHALSLDQLFQPNLRFLVARLAGEPVGCGGVGFYDGFAEVKRMYTRPVVRGRGVAKALLSRIEDEARAVGYRVLRLETGIRQQEAVGLYRRCGFVECPPFGHYAGMSEAQIGTSRFFEKQL